MTNRETIPRRWGSRARGRKTRDVGGRKKLARVISIYLCNRGYLYRRFNRRPNAVGKNSFESISNQDCFAFRLGEEYIYDISCDRVFSFVFAWMIDKKNYEYTFETHHDLFELFDLIIRRNSIWKLNSTIWGATSRLKNLSINKESRKRLIYNRFKTISTTGGMKSVGEGDGVRDGTKVNRACGNII